MRMTVPWSLGLLTVVGLAALSGCRSTLPNPELAAPAYPAERRLLETRDATGDPVFAPRSANIQVFRDDEQLTIVNGSARSYRDARLWINQRYAKAIGDLTAGQTRRVSLRGFFDVRGEPLESGGFFRLRDATPVWLVELETSETEPLVGLLRIRNEAR